MKCFREGRAPFHFAEVSRLNIGSPDEFHALLYKLANIVEFYLDNKDAYEQWSMSRVNVSLDEEHADVAYEDAVYDHSYDYLSHPSFSNEIYTEPTPTLRDNLDEVPSGHKL